MGEKRYDQMHLSSERGSLKATYEATPRCKINHITVYYYNIHLRRVTCLIYTELNVDYDHT